MTSGAPALTAAVVFAWGACSANLERADLTAPMAFVGVGVLLADSIPAAAARLRRPPGDGDPEPTAARGSVR